MDGNIVTAHDGLIAHYKYNTGEDSVKYICEGAEVPAYLNSFGLSYNYNILNLLAFISGEGGIRTHGTLIRRTADFESAPL